MPRLLAPALLLAAALASCGGKGEQAMTDFTLTSDAFTDGQPIQPGNSCEGRDQSPELNWTDPPEGTKSLALVVDDPDAPGGTFRHWGVYNIGPEARSLAKGAGNETGGTFSMAVNGFGKAVYGGPCPPVGHGVHHYRFTLLALDVPKLDVSAELSVEQLEAAAEPHVVGRAQLTGTYERK
jgi:Raf kinase inhibitor-like YbhB/YbcL family protein